MDNVKTVIIEDTASNKKVKCVKEKRTRVEAKTWDLSEQELSHEMQLHVLQGMNLRDEDVTKDKENISKKYIVKLTSHIKSKLLSYKHQDVVKKRFNIDEFVSLEDTIDLLIQSCMKCCYCSNEVYILYEKVREGSQWSLDRINNDIGHNKGNLVIACLECNLKRRRTNKDAFMFTKNMVIIKSHQG